MPIPQAAVSIPHVAIATDAEHDRLVSLTEGADQLGVHPLTLRRWISEGRLPAVRLGPRLLRVRMSDLEALLHPVPTADGAA